MHWAASKRCQVCAMTGRPATARNNLSTPGPMRTPLPAATIIAEVIIKVPSSKSLKPAHAQLGVRILMSWSPCQYFQLHAAPAVVFVDLRFKGQVKAATGQSGVVRAPPNG